MKQKILSPKTTRKLHRIIPYGLIWMVSGWVFLIVELAVYGSLGELPETAIHMNFPIFVLSSIAMGVVGILTGLIELKYLNNAFSSQNFAIRFFYKLLFYSVFFLLIILITFPTAVSLELHTHIFDKKVWDKYFNYFFSLAHLSTGLQLATSLVLSLFYSEISYFIGQGVLLNFFMGKYHTPIEEERIFMFLDMKSSTTIAEQLGHQKYFQLLRAYYNCFTEAIIEHEAEIYQYVGDEIILSWKYHADERDSRSIQCFFAMKKSLQKKGSWFESRFGIAPTFKAGTHFGKVTVGEIGSIKKEILFTGDVLNATARIQGLCNSFEVDCIISGELMKRLNLSHFCQLSYLGNSILRGKEEKKELYRVYAK